MLNQFSRTQLLLGSDNMDRLADAKVAVFGIGGVGAPVPARRSRRIRGRSTCEKRSRIICPGG